MKIFPGVNVTVSWKRALGVTKVRQKVARATGIPTTKEGMNRKVGRKIINALLGK